jgi:hypothetical protein
MTFARRLAAATVVLSLGAGIAFAQDVTPRDWRRTDLSSDTFAATAVGAEVDGARPVIVVINAPVDRHPEDAPPYRSIVFATEVRCDERIWRITDVTYYTSDLQVADRKGPVPEAPLIRETPLHAAISDACDGGYENPVGLTTSDPPEVVDWLAKAPRPAVD